MADKKNLSIAVIGGGAAGFFTAINTARLNPDIHVTIFEKSRELLSKVRISGGGRCNVTHHCFDPEKLAGFYPRGGRVLRWSFEQFQPRDTVRWFEDRGVELKAEKDGRMFPVTDRSETIITCLLQEADKYRVNIRTKTKVENIKQIENQRFLIYTNRGSAKEYDSVVIASGGYNRESAYKWLKNLGHKIVAPVPSLFTFNFREKIFSDLAGISIDHVNIKIEDTHFEESGPVLLTHWGMSGPAVLKLSAWAARILHEKEYRFTIRVNWVFPLNEIDVRAKLLVLRDETAKKIIGKQHLFTFPNRLWDQFLTMVSIDRNKRWAELSNSEIHELTHLLVQSRFHIQGKTTYKEEFVTCGGIPLNEINPDTLESKIIPGLFFAGEVLDIDGVTGGFNFQAAWTNGWLAAQAISQKYQ